MNQISKSGEKSFINASKNKYLACKPNKKLGKTGCNMIALCKAGALQINSQEAFNSSKFNQSLQLFLTREGRNVITSYWRCQTDLPEYTSMAISLPWSIMLARKLGLSMLQKSCCHSNLSKPFLLLPPQNLWACLSSRISSNEFQQVNLSLTMSKNCSLISRRAEF